jgi:adenine-specific DNA-methyltransferase
MTSRKAPHESPDVSSRPVESEQRTSPAQPTPSYTPADPRDARIAELEQRLAEMQDGDAEGQNPIIHLIWRGGKHARLAVPRPRFLVDVPEHSDPIDEDPGNLVIEGDNRQAMVSLLSQYAGRVDVVLTDPPYNTGKGDFRYNDARFADPDDDTDGGKFVSGEDGGRHGKWLNQMAPTLRVIHALMAKHGVLFMHINDAELPRLLLLLEEVFDERNYLGTLIWKSATDNNPSQIVIEHEYIVAWAKAKEHLPKAWRGPMGLAKTVMLAEYERLKAEDSSEETIGNRWRSWMRRHKKELPTGLALYEFADSHAPFRGGDLQNPGEGDYHYDIIHPVIGKACREPLFGWRYPENAMKDLIDAGRVLFGKDETTIPQYKRYLTDIESEPLRSVIGMFGGKAVNADVRRLFPEQPSTFPRPKPVGLEEMLLSYVADPEAIILDPFAGSGTTAHAVMRLNKRDGGKRRFILIEEGNKGDNYATTLTAERLRRARVSEDLPGGFTFQRIGDRIDMDSFARLRRNQVVDAVLQTDASGRGGGIRAIEGAQWVIGRNVRNEAICLLFDSDEHAALTSEILREMYGEANELGLNKPLRVYGTRTEVFASDSFRFFKLPDEVSTNLVMSLRGGQ